MLREKVTVHLKDALLAHGAVVSAGGFDGVTVFAGVGDVGYLVKGDILR